MVVWEVANIQATMYCVQRRIQEWYSGSSFTLPVPALDHNIHVPLSLLTAHHHAELTLLS